MSDRPRITSNVNKPLINAQSMASSINGPPTNINGIPGISYDLVWTGTPTGTFQVQVSNSYSQDPEGNPINAGSWNTLPTSSFSGTYPVPAGSSGFGFLDVVGTEAAWVRLQYTAASGTGTLTVIAAAKVW
jgi:hypothetical protein